MTEETPCDHVFKYLRQETRNEGSARNPNWVPYDVFFCEKCLQIAKHRIDSNYAEFTGKRNEARR